MSIYYIPKLGLSLDWSDLPPQQAPFLQSPIHFVKKSTRLLRHMSSTDFLEHKYNRLVELEPNSMMHC